MNTGGFFSLERYELKYLNCREHVFKCDGSVFITLSTIPHGYLWSLWSGMKRQGLSFRFPVSFWVSIEHTFWLQHVCLGALSKNRALLFKRLLSLAYHDLSFLYSFRPQPPEVTAVAVFHFGGVVVHGGIGMCSRAYNKPWKSSCIDFSLLHAALERYKTTFFFLTLHICVCTHFWVVLLFQE